MKAREESEGGNREEGKTLKIFKEKKEKEKTLTILREKKEKEKTLKILREKKEKEKNLQGLIFAGAAGCREILFAYSGGPGLSGYCWWNRLWSSSEWVRSQAEIHEVSSLVPS